MNGSLFVSSKLWPLTLKMEHTNFPAEPVEPAGTASADGDCVVQSRRHPVQGVIAVSGTTEGAIARGAGDTGSALDMANNSTSDAISVAGDSTGNALGTSYRKTVHALGTSAKNVGRALGIVAKPKSESGQPK